MKYQNYHYLQIVKLRKTCLEFLEILKYFKFYVILCSKFLQYFSTFFKFKLIILQYMKLSNPH